MLHTFSYISKIITSQSLTGISTLALAILNFLYLLETRASRINQEKYIQKDNSKVVVKIGRIKKHKSYLKKQLPVLGFEIEFKNLGTKPAYDIALKTLTKRSPKQCISHHVFPGSENEYKQSFKTKKTIFRRSEDALMPEGKHAKKFFIVLEKRLLDDNKSFCLWCKYTDFYDRKHDVIKQIIITEKGQTITNIDTPKKTNWKFNLNLLNSP
jgi:predicted nucleic-acid-binding Zn-ribbon protein